MSWGRPEKGMLARGRERKKYSYGGRVNGEGRGHDWGAGLPGTEGQFWKS